jgi:hypothetical protein
MVAQEKPKYEFEGVKHTLEIDQDIWDHTQRYVLDQIAIMQRHGSQPDPPLTQAQFEDLVYVTAKYPQQVRNLRKKNETPTISRPDSI